MASGEQYKSQMLRQSQRQLESAKRQVREMKLKVRRLETKAARADRLEAAIKEHHRQVVELENWGADDDLWKAMAIKGRPEDYRERMAA